MQNRTEQSRAEQSKSRDLLYLFVIFLLYLSFNAFTQFSVSKTADLDQAEQLILSQALQLGYGAQPPLYTYVVSFIFSLTGPGIAPLLGLKVLLLSFLIGTLISLGIQFKFTIRQHLIAMLGVVFIPQIIWESQRDLTHSVLATTIAAGTLLQVVRTQRSPVITNYIVLGLLIGLGLISKYNYAIFLASLIFSILSVPSYRLILTNSRVLAAIFVLIVVSTPHIFWAISNFGIATSSAHKLQSGTGDLFSGLTHVAFSALSFLTPLWFFSTFIISSVLKKHILETAKTDDGRLLINLLLMTIIIIVLFVISSGVQQLKSRWFQPLLFYAPITVALFATRMQARLSYWYFSSAIVFAILVSVALPARTVLAERLNKYSRPNMPYPNIFKSISNSVGKPSFIIAETNLLAGNSRPFFVESKIYVPSYTIQLGSISGSGVVICETPHCDNSKFKEWLMRNYTIDARLLKFNEIEKQYYYAPSKKMKVYWSKVSVKN